MKNIVNRVIEFINIYQDFFLLLILRDVERRLILYHRDEITLNKLCTHTYIYLCT